MPLLWKILKPQDKEKLKGLRSQLGGNGGFPDPEEYQPLDIDISLIGRWETLNEIEYIMKLPPRIFLQRTGK